MRMRKYIVLPSAVPICSFFPSKSLVRLFNFYPSFLHDSEPVAMKCILSLVVLAATLLVDVDARRNSPGAAEGNVVPSTVFAPTPMPNRNRHE